MSIIARYLVVEFLTASGAVFLALFVTFLAAYSMTHLDLLGATTGLGGWEILFRSLEMLPVGVPIACLAGVVWSLTHAVRYREITAIRCGGIPLQRVLAPVLVSCLLIGAALAVFEDRVIVPTRAALLESERSEEGSAAGPRNLNDRWWFASGSSVFSAAAYLPEEHRLEAVTVFELDRDQHIRQRIEAAEAVYLGDHSWELRQARVFDLGLDRTVGITEHPRLILDLGLSGQDLARATPDPQQATLHRLAQRIRRHRGARSSLMVLQTAFHQRLSQHLAVLVLVLLALPFAIGDVERPDSLPRALLRALAAGIVFWTASGLSLAGASSGVVPPAFPIWGVPLLFLGIGSWRFRRIKE